MSVCRLKFCCSSCVALVLHEHIYNLHQNLQKEMYKLPVNCRQGQRVITSSSVSIRGCPSHKHRRIPGSAYLYKSLFIFSPFYIYNFLMIILFFYTYFNLTFPFLFILIFRAWSPEDYVILPHKQSVWSHFFSSFKMDLVSFHIQKRFLWNLLQWQ